MWPFQSYEYDLIAIGGGAAGLVAAGMAASLGAKTALIESHRLGGDCTWTGCIPSKTLLHTAGIFHAARHSRHRGVSAAPVLAFAKAMEHVHLVRQEIYDDADAPPNLEKLGVEVIAGRAVFTSPHRLKVAMNDGTTRELTSRFFVIATGSSPRKPEFGDLCLTNESIFELERLPARLVVIGAGPVGVEMSQAFRRLGSEVTVVASSDHILPRDEADLAHMLQGALEAEGIRFLLGHKAVKAERKPTGTIEVTLSNGESLSCDAVLAATGRAANIAGLGLDRAGVRATDQGIGTNARMRTSRRHIFASGDVTGRYLFTHMAEHMSVIAVQNALLKWPASIDEAHVPWCTFTDPELARVGASEQQLQKEGASYKVFRFPFAKLDRAITEGATTGEVKVLAGPKGKVLGASVLGARAGEMIAQWALAMKHGIKLSGVSQLIHPYPTYMLGNRRAADQWFTRQLDSPWLGLLGKVLGYRGERKGSAVLEE